MPTDLRGQPERIGRYRVERLLGTGGFATVWLGYDETLDAHVAIKVLAENWSHHLDVRERFLDEARLLWKLDDERIVKVHTVGELDDGRPYSIMSWADEGSLRDRIAAGPLPRNEAHRILAEVAAGVASLHRHGIIHRDVNPGNVLFRSVGRPGLPSVMIADLGMAKEVANASGLTVSAGTPGYMAPEQHTALSTVSTRTDVFALGVLGTELLGPSASDAVGEVLRAATALEPDDRYQDAAAFVEALHIATGEPEGVSDPPPDGRRRWPIVAVLATAIAITAIVLSVALAGDDRYSDDQGRLHLSPPSGWEAVGGGWLGTESADGTNWPGIAVSPQLDRWTADPSVSGAFVGLVLDTNRSPEDVAAERRHRDCATNRSDRTTLGDHTWTRVTWTGCAGGSTFVEAAAESKTGEVVYAQVKRSPGLDVSTVDELLDSVEVSSP